MNVLEKILEEISEVEKEHVTGHKVLYALGATSMATEISSIIRSHMDDVPDNNSGWIPIEERVPEDLEKVLVWYEYFRYGEYHCMFETYGIGWQLDGHWGGDVSGTKARCIAWQPLPEAYHPKETPAAEHIMSRFTRVE